MDASQLAKAMLEWEQAQTAADLLKAEIEAAVLEVGQTQTVGNVRCTYSSPRKSYDYQMAAADVDEDVIREYTVIKESIDWRGICQACDIKDIPFSASEARATLKMLS